MQPDYYANQQLHAPPAPVTTDVEKGLDATVHESSSGSPAPVTTIFGREFAT